MRLINFTHVKKMVIIVITIFLLLSIFVDSNNFILNVSRSFTIQYTLFFFAVSITFLFLKKYIFSLVYLIISLASILFIVQRINNTVELTETKYSDENLKIVHFNILYHNTQYDTLLSIIDQLNPDLFSIQEFRSSYTNKLLIEFIEKYPYKIIEDQCEDFNILIFSKFPLENTKIQYFSHEKRKIPYFTSSVECKTGMIDLICLHAMPPFSKNDLLERNKQLHFISNLASNAKNPVVIIGDLNIVPWSYEVHNLKKNARVKDSRSYINPTFPANNFLLRIPIDYILYSEDIICNQFKVIKIPGSDHLGIYGEYILN